jgi:hypothetical protein
MRQLTTLLMTLSLAWAAAAGPPRPVESEWLGTKNGTFLTEGGPRGRGIQYHLEFEFRKPVTQRLYVTVDFENPRDRESPMFAELEVPAGATVLEAKSDYFQGIRNGRKYLVKVWIYADLKRTQPLGTHEQQVLFKLPRELLQQLGVELL